jgi:hypothetical protein
MGGINPPLQSVANMAKPPIPAEWTHPNAPDIQAKQFTCGFCDRDIASAKGFSTNVAAIRVYLCPFCRRPTFFEQDLQHPGVSFGEAVSHLPPAVAVVYDEARRCCSIDAHTAAGHLLRKLLMHVAVEKGAPEDQSFAAYVTYLSQNGYVPPDGKDWVDHIRLKGNEAAHEIRPMTGDDARDLVTFAEMLLKFVYEFPALMNARKAAAARS